jgi:hypothetical protein
MMAKRSKIKPGLFRAAGASHDVLIKTYREINRAYKSLEALENKAFGPPRSGDTTTALGVTLRNYGARPHAEWTDNGKLAGFRFNWDVLNRPGRIQYAIPSIDIPEGWFAVPKRPGVYRPHASMLPDIAAMFDAITMPDLIRLPEIMGPSPIVTIRHTKGTFPRAYQQWPDVHIDYDRQGNISFVIDAPKNYKDRIFQPEGSIPMTEDQWWEFRSHYGDMYEPYGQSRPYGVTTPDDYKNTRRTNAKSDMRYFLAVGETAKLYAQFQRQQKHADDAQSKLMRDWGSTGGVSYCGNELVSTTFKQDPGKGWVRSTESFPKDSYVPDESIPEGRRLKEIFAQLPKRPNLVDFQAMLTPGEAWMKFPMTSNFDGLSITVLEYPSKVDGRSIIPPPGALEMPSQVYAWLKADRNDEMCGMKPPPMPPALRAAYEKFLSDVKTIKPSDPSGNAPRP